MGSIARRLFVDATSGDVADVTAGIAAAVAGGVSTTNQWILELGIGNFSPPGGSTYVELPAGLSMQGQGTHRSNFFGSIIIHPFSSLRNLRVLPADGTVEFGVRCVFDSSNASIQLDNVNVTVSHSSLLGTLSAIEVEGSATGGFLYAMPGCYLYAQNRYTASNASGLAKSAVFRLKSDVRCWVEGWGIHAKTSGGSTGTAIQVLRLIECNPTPSVNDFGYVELRASLWNNPYGGTGGIPEGYSLLSVNAAWPGQGGSDESYWSQGGGKPLFSSAYTGSVASHTWRTQRGLDVEVGAITQREGGVSYPHVPVVTLDHIPTVSDVAPAGTIAIVTS